MATAKAKQKRKEQPEIDQAEQTGMNHSADKNDEPKQIKVCLRTALWQGKRIDQRRRADVVAFAEWNEILVSPEQLEAIRKDEFIEVVQ